MFEDIALSSISVERWEGKRVVEEIKEYLNGLTFETMGSIVAGEEGLTPAITQVAVTISDPDFTLPVSIALIAESHIGRSGRGWGQSLQEDRRWMLLSLLVAQFWELRQELGKNFFRSWMEDFQVGLL